MKNTMQNFPRIHHIDDLRRAVSDKEEIRFNVQPNGYHVVCYMISNNDTFDSDMARECRGITFYPNGNIASRPLTKFFNLGERESTQQHNIDWSKVTRVMDKRDGSMAQAVLVNNRVTFKSKKSFESDVAKMMNAYAEKNTNVQDLCFDMMFKGITPVFEFTSPNARIVLPHKEDEMYLLHARENVTGRYLTHEELIRWANPHGVAVVANILTDDFNIDDLLAYVETAEGIEGYVIQFENGDMVKIKTPWYLALHHTVTFTRERDVAEMILNETIDDYKSYLTEVGVSHDKVIDIENRIVKIMNDLQSSVESMANVDKDLDRKDFAIKNRMNPLFALMIKHYCGEVVPYQSHFEKYILNDEFGLEQV